MLVLFIDDDQAEVLDWRENSGTRADDDAGAVLADFLPFVVAFPCGEIAVQNRDQRLQWA